MLDIQLDELATATPCTLWVAESLIIPKGHRVSRHGGLLLLQLRG